MSWSAARRGILAGALVFLAACGADPATIPFDSIPADTTTTTTAVTPPPTLATIPEEPVLVDRVGTDWTLAIGNLAGMESECGNLSNITTWPGRDALIAGIALQGLWISVDGGESWDRLGTGADSSPIINRPSSIVFDPENADRFWETGTYNSGSVYRTDDGGDDFTQLGEPPWSDFIAIDFSDPDRQTMLVGRHESSELDRSTDGGLTWAERSGDLPIDIGQLSGAVVFDPATYLVGAIRGASSGVYRTINTGTTWTRVYNGGVSGRPLVRSNGTIFWLLASGAGLISSTDDGATWHVHHGGGVNFGATSLILMPDGRLATFGDDQVVLSSDEGDTWRPNGPTFPFTPSGMVYSPERKAFYIWRSDCSFTADNSVGLDAIQMLSFELAGDVSSTTTPGSTPVTASDTAAVTVPDTAAVTDAVTAPAITPGSTA